MKSRDKSKKGKLKRKDCLRSSKKNAEKRIIVYINT